MKYVYLTLNWVFGVTFALGGILALFSDPITALPLVGMALFLLPPVRKFAFEKTGKSLSVKERSISIFILLVIFGVLASHSQKEKERLVAEKVAQERVEKLVAIKEENIAYLKANRLVLLLEFRSEFDKGNYQGVITKADKYLVSNDPELTELIDLAKIKLDEIRKKENAERLLAEKNKTTERILAELKTVPASNLEKNQKLYRELVSIYPDNSKYKTKFELYSKKIADKNEKQRLVEERKKKIKAQFSAWDGSHRNLERYIKDAMNDPDSYDHDDTVYWDMKTHLVVRTTFRGKNAFGAVIKNSVKAKVSLNGDILEIMN